MKAKQAYLNGKSVFIVSLIVIIITILTVYLSGIHYHRTITTNLYLSLSIIATTLFVFMVYGLYTGIGLKDDYPLFKNYKVGDYIPQSGNLPDVDLPDIDLGDGIAGLVFAIFFWIGITIVFMVLLVLLEVVFWVSLFIIIAMMYWVFFSALKLVFSKASVSRGDIGISIVYAFSYTVLYTGWIYAIVYIAQTLK